MWRFICVMGKDMLQVVRGVGDFGVYIPRVLLQIYTSGLVIVPTIMSSSLHSHPLLIHFGPLLGMGDEIVIT